MTEKATTPVRSGGTAVAAEPSGYSGSSYTRRSSTTSRRGATLRSSTTSAGAIPPARRPDQQGHDQTQCADEHEHDADDVEVEARDADVGREREDRAERDQEDADSDAHAQASSRERGLPATTYPLPRQDSPTGRPADRPGRRHTGTRPKSFTDGSARFQPPRVRGGLSALHALARRRCFCMSRSRQYVVDSHAMDQLGCPRGRRRRGSSTSLERQTAGVTTRRGWPGEVIERYR